MPQRLPQETVGPLGSSGSNGNSVFDSDDDSDGGSNGDADGDSVGEVAPTSTSVSDDDSDGDPGGDSAGDSDSDTNDNSYGEAAPYSAGEAISRDQLRTGMKASTIALTCKRENVKQMPAPQTQAVTKIVSQFEPLVTCAGCWCCPVKPEGGAVTKA